MAEARDIAVNREFIVSGFMSGQAFRLAVRVDNAATRLIRLGLRDFDQALTLEQYLVTALNDLDRTAKDIRKKVDKVNRRRREGVPSSGTKQTYMVRSLPSALAYRCAVAIDQIQRDISMLGLVASNDVSKTANEAQSTMSEAIALADSCVQAVLKKTERRRPAQRKDPAPESNSKKATPKPSNTKAPATEQKKVTKSAEKKPTKPDASTADVSPEKAKKADTKETKASDTESPKSSNKAPKESAQSEAVSSAS